MKCGRLLQWQIALMILAISIVCGAHPGHAAETKRKSDTARHFTLTDIYYATAKAGVLREKTITAHYDLIASPGTLRDGKRRVDVHITRVAVKADVPAQRRKASFDSAKDKVDVEFTSHELLRPVSFLNSKLALVFDKDGHLESIEGLEQVEKKARGLFERDFRGSEASMYAADPELDWIDRKRVAESWGSLLYRPMFGAPPANTKAGKRTFHIDASVPSEVWVASLKLSCPVTAKTVVGDNKTRAWQVAGTFKTDKPVKTKIGPCKWSYQITSGSFQDILVQDDGGRFVRAERRLNAVFDTTITISDKGIPLDMSVKHMWILEPAHKSTKP